MLDDFSAAFIAKYKVAGLDDPEAKIAFQQVAQSMNMDAADIESQHASLRRMLKSVVQTHSTAILHMESTRGFKREVRSSHLPKERNRTAAHS